MNADALTGASLRVTRLEKPDDIAVIAPEWDSLAELCHPQTPFIGRLWNETWWTHLRRRTAVSNDRFFHHVVRDACGRLIAVAPLMLTANPGIGAPLVRIIQFIGADPSLTEVRGLICRERDQQRVVVALMKYFLADRTRWDVIRWGGLRTPLSAFGPLVDESDLQDSPVLPDYLVDLPTRWDDLKAGLSSNMRKNLRRPEELLARDGHDFQMRVVTDQDALSQVIETFLRLHSLRSEVADMIEHPNRFDEAPERGFLIAFARAMAARNQLRLFELHLNGVTVASRLAFMAGDDLYLYYAGYDPAWRQYSVMTVLMSRIMRWAIDQGIPRVNLSTGNDQSKTRWRPREILFHAGVQIAPTMRGRFGHRLLENAERLIHRSRAPGDQRDARA